MNGTNEWDATFLGGMNIPMPVRRWPKRFNTTMPLALLRVSFSRLALRTLPMWPRLDAERGEVVACFRLRPIPTIAHGVGFELADGSVAYFWTYRPRAVLDRLHALSWPVEEGKRPFGLLQYLGFRS